MSAAKLVPPRVEWPSIESIFEAFHDAVSILDGFAELSYDVEMAADSGGLNIGVWTDDETRRWVAERREIVESVAYVFGTIVTGEDGVRVERCIREAMDIITGGSAAGKAVTRRDRFR